MATVRSPNSLAARRMRMAISLRFSASSFFTGVSIRLANSGVLYVGTVMSLRLQGIYPPITTPFDHNGNIYTSKVQHNVEKWNRTALSGYVVMGSTGESVMLTPDEKFTMWELVAKHAAPDKLLIAGTGAESVR